MFTQIHHHRQGTTLVELLLFLAFFGLSAGVLLSFFFLTSEQRVRQQVMTAVDQGGMQIVQSLERRIRDAERILTPIATEQHALLALQTADASLHPTIFGVSGGILYVGEADTLTKMSSDNVTITDFTVTNTSAADDRPSVLISFVASGTLVFDQTQEYMRWFETLIPLSPDDDASAPCSCPAPACVDGNYEWQYCLDAVCTDASVSLPCE